ncbi:hypothetical protein [Streptomyces odonnellii]|uniref:hypothetical protein n=1 Tax=Streptomyces odonnellii TaxID=1417980 RepID=UPI0006250E0D|nr:hypothetical protein [Streptomyces odonnellii]
MSVTDHRRLGIALGAAFLSLSLAGCSGLGRNAMGVITYNTERHRGVQVSNPLVTGCHRLSLPGAVELTNNTLVDLVLYRTTDCTPDGITYVATTLSDVIAPGSHPWLSFRVVH